MRTARSITLVAIALFISSSPSQAECIGPPPPCEAIKRTAIVVLADVLDVVKTNRPEGAVDLHLRVVERFKGAVRKQRELWPTITPLSPTLSPVSPDTVVPTNGGRWLIFARVSPDGDWATACTPTHIPIPDGKEVRTLRHCR